MKKCFSDIAPIIITPLKFPAIIESGKVIAEPEHFSKASLQV